MTRNFDPQQGFKAAMRVIANLVGNSSGEDALNDFRDAGHNPEKLAQDLTDLFEEVYSPFEGKQTLPSPVELTGGNSQLLREIEGSGLLPSTRSFDVVWDCIVKALHGLGIDRVRLYLLSADEQFLVAKAHYGMSTDFMSQRRSVRDEPNWTVLTSDFRLHVFPREPDKSTPFEDGIPEESAVSEWFCLLLRWNGKVVGKLSGDCKESGRRLDVRDLHPIELFAPVLGSAIGHARLLTNLGSVLELSSIAGSCDTSIPRVMMEVCHAARKILGVDHSWMLLFNTDLSFGRIKAEAPASKGRKGIPLRRVALAKLFVKSRAPIVICDVPNELGFGHLRDILDKLEIRSLLIVPVNSSGRLIGALVLGARKNIYRFSEADIALATIFASQIGVAMESHRRKVECRIESRKLAQLDEAVEAMLVKNNFDELAQLIAVKARDLFNASFAVFRRFGPVSCAGVERVVFSSGIEIRDWMAIEERVPERDRMIKVVSDKGWVEISDVFNCDQTFSGLRSRPDVSCFQGLALKIRDEVEGGLFLAYSRPNVFNAEQRRHVRKFVAFAALCLHRTKAIIANSKSAARSIAERLKTHVSIFYEASKIVTSASRGVKPAEILDHILKQAIECTKIGKDSFGSRFGTIWVFDASSNTLRLVNAYPREVLDERPIGYTYTILKDFGKIGVTGRAVIDNAPQRVPNVLIDEDYIELSASTLSELAVPIVEGNTLLGVLNLECDEEEAFDEIDENAVTALAGLAAIAIQNSRERYMLSTALQV